MARELGFQPRSLIKNIPSPSQPWKAPVREWVRDLYQKKIGSRVRASIPPQPRKPEYSWPDNPEIPELVMVEEIEDEDEEVDEDFFGFPFRNDFEPLSGDDIDQQNTRMLRRQCLFRWAAQLVAITMSELPEVQTVAAFGAIAQPLKTEVPRFRQYRRERIEVLHECADLDLAVWLTGESDLKKLKNAMSRGLSILQDTHYGGVAHHQVDVHVFDAGSGAYRGRLCGFGQCPKAGKSQCRVRGCGAQPFLQQFEGFRWNAARFEGEPRVTLVERSTGFRVNLPVIDAKPAKIVYRARREKADFDDEDGPF